MWTHLAKWHGMTETNIGMASETELITNNGEIAETLETYLFREGITEEIKLAIEEFQTWLEKYLILTKNLIPHNLVISQQNERIIIKSLTVWAHKHLFLFQTTQVFLLKDTLKEEFN